MITAEQRDLRTKYIGSSDAAAVVGVDPYRSASDVYAEKTGLATAFAGNAATRRGNVLEPAILSWAEEQLGTSFRRDTMIIHPSDLLAANLDAILEKGISGCGGPELVEAKSSILAEDWGEEGTDDVPKRVTIQVHHQFAVAGPDFRVCWVPVLLPGYMSFDFRMYRIDRNDALAEGVAEAGIDFMQRHVRLGIPPDGFLPSLEVVKRYARLEEKSVAIADELILAYEAARESVKKAEEKKEEAQRRILSALGDAEVGKYSGGSVTYYETNRKEYAVKASTFRTMRISSKKSK